eukprot:5010913-Alexandrium_andersonii.AAC.1
MAAQAPLHAAQGHQNARPGAPRSLPPAPTWFLNQAGNRGQTKPLGLTRFNTRWGGTTSWSQL